MQVKTLSGRPASSYQNDWGQDIKVEIPETGVSASELYRYLRQWLGNETHITGEVYRTAVGIAITARAGALPGATARGTEADLDRLVQQAAEAVYGQTQPYRYAAYLASSGRTQEGVAALRRLAASGPSQERGWAHMALGGILYSTGDPQGAVREEMAAAALAPRLEQAHATWAASLELQAGLGHDEAALFEWTQALTLVRDGRAIETIDMPDAERKAIVQALESARERLRGDFGAAAAVDASRESFTVEASRSFSLIPTRVTDLESAHDLGAARRLIDPGRLSNAAYELSGEMERAQLDKALDDWPGIVAELEPRQATEIAAGPSERVEMERVFLPDLALAYAHVGRQAEAEAMIAQAPMDCDECVLTRGRIAAAKGDWTDAAKWFAVTAARSPSIPFATYEWGKMLMTEGDLDGAIGKLKVANRAGPHFADALELWGEA